MPMPRCTSPTVRLPMALGLAVLALAGLTACGETARLTVRDGTGPDPVLPPPVRTLLPTAVIAPAAGWPAGQKPTPAPGLAVQAFAEGLDHPRWLYRLPNGDILVAETNAPARPPATGLRAWATRYLMGRAGARSPSADRLLLLRDADGDGQAETRHVFLAGLHSPFGMALVDGRLYVANADAVVSVPYRDGDVQAREAPTRLVGLPGGPRNHHWTKSLIASPDGRHLYVGVGSNSNAAEHGLAEEAGRAAVHEIDLPGGASRIFASGLRNPVGLAWTPGPAPRLWTVVNERDELGSDLVPDYLTAVEPGAFYGWPWSYYGDHVDTRVQPPNPAAVARARRPDYALGPHTASLGLAWLDQGPLQAVLGTGMVVGQHGSWNRQPPSGYQVVHVPFVDGRPSGWPRTVLDGFLDETGRARGRPVGVAQDASGALLVADDVGNVVWRVTHQP